MKTLFGIAVLTLSAAVSMHGQNPSTALRAGNWVHVGQDPGHSKYSALDQINTGNVQKLEREWLRKRVCGV